MSLDLFENSRFTYQTPDQICKIINHVLDINGKDDVLNNNLNSRNYYNANRLFLNVLFWNISSIWTYNYKFNF